MQEQSDAQLLREYAEHRNEAAFHEIVGRYTNLVYSSALRQVASSDLARDVAQSVFTDLAAKARSLVAKSAGEPSLAGWLYRGTRFAALNLLREDRRRQARERQAMEHFDPTTETAPEWDLVRPVLDEAMMDLSDEDREALLLRFFKSHDFRAIGQSLGVSDDAAQKRVSRALERLRAHLTSRGVTASMVALSTALSTHAVTFAPAGLAVSLSTAALAGTTTAAVTTTATAAKAIVMTTLKKTVIIATITVAVVTIFVFIHRSDSPPSANVAPNPQTKSPVAAKAPSDSIFWRRLESSRRAQKAVLSANEKLLDSLARLKIALYSAPVSGGPLNDPAHKILSEIPLEQRAAALEMVMQALHDSQRHICRRAIHLIPLIWPEGEAALPPLFDLVRNKSGDWPGLTTDALIAAVQVRSETDVIPELVLAAMQGSHRSQSELALQLPILTAQIKDSGAVFAANLQPFLNSADPDARLTAAQALAQLPGAKDNLVVTELAASLALNDGTRATTDKIRTSLDALFKMGAEARDAVPALLALAKENPELSDSAWVVLKAVAPDALKGINVPTPLPPHEGTSQAISQNLAAGTWTIQNAIDALKSPDLLLPTARALADYGPGAAEALPAMRQALEALAVTNLNAAIVLSAAIERLDPTQPKPLLLAWDILPALEGVRAEAQKANISEWDEALASLHERVPLGGLALNHNDVRRLAAELGRINPRLQQVFQAKLLGVDARFAVIFSTAAKP
jgi:RNA polymerase sigma factor (sigma-70 family)